ncbi:MAG: gamma-glutamylcyclotransferase [Pseudorhodobacter sp.]|nr:gamma-glutamylcyclotransferase [Pseudorhodobacter sp.]
MMNCFFYGTLCHAPLRNAVLGRALAAEPAVLPDHAVFWAEGQAFPLILAAPGGRAVGVMLRGLMPDDVARLDFYEGGFGYQAREVPVLAQGGAVPARVYFPQSGQWQPGAGWSLADWAARWGDIVVATAGDVMRLLGQKPAAEVWARHGPMLARGASRLRAAMPSPTMQRRAAETGDVVIATSHQGYGNFFAVEDYVLRHRRFDGRLGPQVTRAAFVSCDAVTVLPYDPKRDRVLLVEQFRIGPLARGDAQPWLLEPIAGRIDAGESPEAAARREAVEEAGLTLGALLSVASYYPSPGAKSEYIYSYVALCDLPDGVAGTFGLASEAEDIRGHLLSFDDFQALVDSGEANSAPLLLTALWLARARDRLRTG